MRTKKGLYYIKKRLYPTNFWGGPVMIGFVLIHFHALVCTYNFFVYCENDSHTEQGNGQYQKVPQCTCADARSTPTFPLTITLLHALKQFNPWPLQRLKLAGEQGQGTQKVKRSAYFDLDTTKCAYFAAQGDKPCWGFELACKLLLYLES